MALLEHIGRFFDPLSILIVFGGAFAIAVARSARGDVARAFAALGPMVRGDPEADAAAATRAANAVEAVAQLKGIACADRVQTAGRFLRRAAFQLSSASSPERFALWARSELAERRRRHAGAAGFWAALADAAPAMGMIGTIAGLIGMFAAMDDAARIGPPMALALLTTLYGIILSSAIAGPIAARLERLSEAEIAWQRRVLDRFEMLAHAELNGVRPALRVVS
ncbi:MotA/TolQ/ExbB proton channel family protein [Sphingomonas sp. KC8]|uniref:MotA/TolQ/ExbB proton channel family protein n=1 Tax=Sphingomonas sp. KC8 TaxID=1030157 RepID=UPI00031E39B1|nr:MotA/TolQ/ExbB proton channel family protein [Sphingomonas sp. KC8]ARS27735.1 flagellar motor protein [Sphingomonas sp. KC8]